MGTKFLVFVFSFLSILYFSSEDATADVKLCSTDAECGANAGCLSGSCLCNPQWYNCDANFGNGCEHHYSCVNTCTPVVQKYCYGNDAWGTGQSSDCGISAALNIECGKSSCPGAWGYTCDPNPFCLARGTTASCVECRTDADCTGGKICNLNTHTCVTRTCTKCPDLTPCEDPPICSRATPGNRCVDNGQGAGVLTPDPSCSACTKVSVQTGIATNQGSHKSIPEICLDSYDGTRYTNYKVDEYAGTANNIKETYCDANNKCGQNEVSCAATDTLSRIDVSKSKFVQLWTNVPAIPANTYTFYCNDGSNGGGIPPPPSPPPPPACTKCGTEQVCSGECVPGNPPYKYDSSCNKVAACGQCGCPPSQYPGTTVSCNAGTGLCSYATPPGLPGEPPDCPLTTPEAEYNITYTVPTLYLLSGSDSSFAGYNGSGTLWQSNSGILLGLSNIVNGAPAVLFEGSETYLIIGRGDGNFSGYRWNGTVWRANASIAAGLPDLGTNSKPSVFYMDGKWNMLAGNDSGDFSGFTRSGGLWAQNATLAAGLPDVGWNAAPSVFYSGTVFLIAGNKAGKFSGYYWNGSGWTAYSNITAGLSDVPAYSSPYVFYKNNKMYLITGKGDGSFAGYNWTDTAWQPDSGIVSGLSAVSSRALPSVFTIYSTYAKTFKYATRFVLQTLNVYNAGSPNPSCPSSYDCGQNKTTFTVPPGHACVVNVTANTTHGWGVRLKMTTAPGKTLLADPYNTCGYVNSDLYNYCYPTGFGGTNICPANLTPTLQEGTYEFGIVSSSCVNNNKVSKACVFIDKCSDCTNPYAQYYCDLCVKDSCSNGMQDCNEQGVDCGGSCVSGHESDNSYVNVFEYSAPEGLINPLLFGNSKGLNCVDGIDNDRDCLVDCDDPDCAGSTICSAQAMGDATPPETTIIFNPLAPNGKNGIYITDVTVSFRCEDIESECEYTQYRLNGGEWKNYLVPFVISEEDYTLIEYYSKNRAGLVESVKSNTTRIFKTPPGLTLVGPADMQIAVGSTGRMTVLIKNLLKINDRVNLFVKGKPESINNWVWFDGHRHDESKYATDVDLAPGEEKAVAIDIFGGEVTAGYAVQPSVTLTAESDLTGLKSEVSSNIYISFEDSGLFVQTPEFGWIAYVFIALLGAILAGKYI